MNNTNIEISREKKCFMIITKIVIRTKSVKSITIFNKNQIILCLGTICDMERHNIQVLMSFTIGRNSVCVCSQLY